MPLSDNTSSARGVVRGRHYTEYVEDVKVLRRTGREIEAERLLLELVDATEAEARAEKWGVAPRYYEQLAISYRKQGDPQGEVNILERLRPPDACTGLYATRADHTA